MNMDNTADPWLWLEEVDSERALAWVRERNAESEAALESLPGQPAMRERMRAVLDSPQQIPYVVRRGDHLYNLWRDQAQPRGLWRRTTLAEFRKEAPELPMWETVIDLDALAKREGENWVWAGATSFAPEHRRVLIALSRGGADATVVREFDTVERQFVADGFRIEEAKTRASWLDADTLIVGSDVGPGSLTHSGYPRQLRRWRRGTALAEAPVVFEGEVADVSVSVDIDRTPGFERVVFERALDFYRSRAWLQQGAAQLPINKPADAQLNFWREWVLLELRSSWKLPTRTWPAGSLLAARAERFLAGDNDFEAVFTPTPTCSLASYTATASQLVLDLLDQVASRVETRRFVEGRWLAQRLAMPEPGHLSVTALHDPLIDNDPQGETLFVNYADFLTPDSLLLANTGGAKPQTLKSRPSFFDSSGMRVEQQFATSPDGTKVPYFVVWPRGAKPGVPAPTLLYGYGGFEVSQHPYYSGVMGSEWLARGGVYVLANIRGGGEFGPSWHQAAVGRHKQRSYDDFAAVAEDLIRRGITSAAQLGIEGGSNGGLLVAAVMLQRPELFRAVLCQVPLLDMRRYHRLLAGASWMAEYGDPDQSEDWASMSRWSPYQNVHAGAKLPRVLFTTSTRDDRVHPGHARKMAARMRELGHEVLYWENIEGGHGGAADNVQRARMLALEYAFMQRELGVR
jgi:prolyl oligopeptidase